MTSPRIPESAEGPNWFDLMRRADFAAAWEVCDASLKARRGVPCWHRPRHLQYIWDGTPLRGKRVLVRCYHGLGDTVQFIRYAASLREIAREVIVWAQPALLELLATAEGIDQLLPLHDGVPDIEYDVDVELMELPHVFRSTLDTLPCAMPYLSAKPADLDRLSSELNETHVGGVPSAPMELSGSRDSNTAALKRSLNVGLVWRSGDWDAHRSIPAHLFWPIARMPHVKLFILQHGPALKEWGSAGGIMVGEHTVSEAARWIRAMDLVITADTFAAHLAGALGVAVWTLLPAEADWRWMIDRDDSPWYPTMRLFRQPSPGDWQSIVSRVCHELSK